MESRQPSVPVLLRALIVLVLILQTSTAAAQALCSKTSIYFEVDKFQLDKAAKKRIDSLCNSLQAESYIIELYGYADSTAGADYNLQLSQKRIEAVKSRFQAEKGKTFLFRAKNLGEAASSGTGASERRVDVYAIISKGKYIKFQTAKEEVEVPLSYFGTCGICNSRPRISSYYDAASANAANIELKTTDGDELITAGTVKFEIDNCGNKKPSSKDTITFSVAADNLDPDMIVWEPDTINGRVYWKPSKVQPVFDTINRRYIVRGAGAFMNLDKRKPKYGKPGFILLFPKTFDQLTSRIVSTKSKRSIPTDKDSLFLAGQQTGNTVISVGKINDTYFLLLKSFEGLAAKSSPSDTTANGVKYVRVAMSTYDSLRYQKAPLRIKFKKNAKPQDIGFYLAEYKLFIPVPMPANAKRIKMTVPSPDFDIAYHNKKKLYVLPKTLSQLKFSKGKNMYKLKLNKKRVKKCKGVRD